MELDWSAQSPHIRTLFHPWQPGDGYDEATIQAAEARLGLRLPTTLRNFYLAWGRRRDLTEAMHPLLPPDELELRGDVLLFWAENQAVVLWGVRREVLEEADPPVVVAWNLEEGLEWTPSHASLSDFLDDMTYLHAFCGGAIHGGMTDFRISPLSEQHIAWLEQNWSKATVGELAFMFTPPPTLYVREGQAFFQVPGGLINGPGPLCCLAAREAEALDEVSQRFQIEWAGRW